MKTQEQVVFEHTLLEWHKVIKSIKAISKGAEPRYNPMEGPTLWWKVRDIKPGQKIVFMPSVFREAQPDENIFELPGELECYAYTIDGEEVTR